MCEFFFESSSWKVASYFFTYVSWWASEFSCCTCFYHVTRASSVSFWTNGWERQAKTHCHFTQATISIITGESNQWHFSLPPQLQLVRHLMCCSHCRVRKKWNEKCCRCGWGDKQVFAARWVCDQSNQESTEPDKTQSDSFECRWFFMEKTIHHPTSTVVLYIIVTLHYIH